MMQLAKFGGWVMGWITNTPNKVQNLIDWEDTLGWLFLGMVIFILILNLLFGE